MKLYLHGHDYKYAVEQMLLCLYPDRRPEYPDGKPEGDRAEISLSSAETYVTACCRLVTDGKTVIGKSAFKKSLITDELSRDKLCQRAIKNAFYRASLSSGHTKPVWGALTGVRPGKVFCSLMDGGLSLQEAQRRFVTEYDVSPKRAALCGQTSYVTQKIKAELGKNDICLYVGIPFCPTRCAYCSFVSQSVERSMKLISPFMDALLKELDATAEIINKLNLRVISIYMGGGTPTTLSAQQLHLLCSRLEEAFDLSSLKEYTVEAGRPDTITEEKLRVLRSHGVDRVSVNPQTMSDSVLNAIGRRHSAQDIVDALEKVRAVGGMAVNMDMIAGLTSDSVEGFCSSLKRVIDLNPENITVHTLSLKKGSRITLEGTELPSDAEVGAMLDYANSVLPETGYSPYYLYRQKFMSGGYENIGWAKAGYTNIYNVCIMEELCSIIAMGGGGSTKLVAPGNEKNIRIFAPKYPQEYINNIEKTCREKQGIVDFYSQFKEE